MEIDRQRRVSRMLSSLRDLRIDDNKPRETPVEVAKRRVSKKNIAIKGSIEDGAIYENIRKVNRKATLQDLNLIRKCLSSHFVFSSLISDRHLFEYLLESFFCCEVNEGEFIMKQGDNASSFFVLQKGRFAVIINGEHKREIKAQEGFGELALLYNAPRSASLKALEPSILWGIDRTTFKKVIAETCENQFAENRKFIEEVSFFENLTPNQKDSIASVLIHQKYEKGEKILNQGDPAASFYIVKSGKVRVLEDGVETRKLKAGEFFGENALLIENDFRKYSVEAADGECVLLALGRDTVNQILGRNIAVIVFRNKASNAIRNSPVFSELPKVMIEKLIDTLELKKVPAETVVVRSGDTCRDKLFILLEGTYTKTANGKSEKLDYQGVFFGDTSVTGPHSNDKHQYTIKVETNGLVGSINYNALSSKVFGGTYEDVIERKKSLKNKVKEQKDAVNSFKDKVSKLTTDQLQVVKKLGYGQFGTVYLVTTDRKDDFYAIKCVEKHQILESKLEKHLQNEKQVLEMINHPFILQFGKSLKDSHHIYFLTEFINGMELFDVIREIGLLSSKDSRFYIASLLLTIEYFNKHNIIYRDLKPENVMVDKAGYVKLIDMGTCKIMNAKSILPKTFTIIGTPHYMAPEVLSGKGYSYFADLWSLGVCLYEFMCGYVPFGEDADDPYQIYEEIIKKDLNFPNYIVDDKAKSMIRQLVNKVAEPRLGDSFSSLKNHPWFQGLEWDLLLSKKLKAPFVIPEDKLFDFRSLAGAKKALPKLSQEVSGSSSSKPLKRKDIQADWDKVF